MWSRGQNRPSRRRPPKTWRWYCFGINSVKNCATLANLKLNEIGPELIAAFASERLAGWATDKFHQQLLRALRRVLRLAVEWGVVESTPKVKFLSGEHRREGVIGASEEAVYLAAASPLLHDVSVVLLDTGIRTEECRSLRWENVNWDGGRNGTVLVLVQPELGGKRSPLVSIPPYGRGF